ncbi:PaaI family thioesterase [Pseudodesulfovibrio sp. zrk46]|uniref:PaaI family thioesterase n=1 Tax=Pseudodesulfovibrio sp. zrk46 TaxID=2725288 RepID=UPI001449FBB3|nr:PaaI family thioesterase [Pseudodesulfovibrio sp. zrk46]QJB56116.1 PaaI family thioesterase [Pseudodesulfovibrio sp. zrk46]
MPHNYLEQVRQPEQSVNPLFRHLGIEVVELDADRAVLRLPVKPELIQGAGNAAGGVLATLLDETMAHAVLSGNQPGQLTSTVDMNVSFLRPVKSGDTLLCEATVTKRGSRILFTEATATTKNVAVAKATATFIML